MYAFKLNPQEVIGRLPDGTPVTASVDFIRRWDEFFTRIGGNTALTNIELEAALASAEDSASARPPDIPQTTEDDTAPPGAFFTPDTPTDARIEALEAAVQTLVSEIEALKQGLYA